MADGFTRVILRGKKWSYFTLLEITGFWRPHLLGKAPSLHSCPMLFCEMFFFVGGLQQESLNGTHFGGIKVDANLSFEGFPSKNGALFDY